MKLREWLRGFLKDEEAMGTIEVILIIAVIIIIALLFKKWIIALIQKLMGKADQEANKIFND